MSKNRTPSLGQLLDFYTPRNGASLWVRALDAQHDYEAHARLTANLRTARTATSERRVWA